MSQFLRVFLPTFFHRSPRGNLVSIGQAFRNHGGSTFTEKDRNKLNYRIGSPRSDSVIKLVSDLIPESDQAVRAVHSWFIFLVYLLKSPLADHWDLIRLHSNNNIVSRNDSDVMALFNLTGRRAVPQLGKKCV